MFARSSWHRRRLAHRWSRRMMVCAVPLCENRVRCRNLCDGHYTRLRKTGDVQADEPLRQRSPRPAICTIEDCDRSPVIARGMCDHHYNRVYYAEIADTKRVQSLAWYHANAERCLARQRLRRPQGRAATNAHYERNADRIRTLRRSQRAHDPITARAAERRWRSRNPDLVRLKAARRRARKMGAPGSATVAQIAARVEIFGSRCWMCHGPWTSIDHVKPLAAGGSEWPANLRPACTPCNSRKRSRWFGVAGLAHVRDLVLGKAA